MLLVAGVVAERYALAPQEAAPAGPEPCECGCVGLRVALGVLVTDRAGVPVDLRLEFWRS